jgi:phosphate transport system substrate-binding protein
MSAQPTGGTTATTPNDQLSSSPARRRSSTVGMGVAIAIAVILLIVGIAVGYVIYPAANPSKSSNTTTKASLTETGSSLFYPLMTRWAGNYSAATISAASTGSGTGQASAILNLVNFGASDGYLTNASSDNIANFPAAISAQLIFYNLPGVSGHLNLNGTILGEIYDGTITAWNSPLIAAANPGVNLPTNAIVPLARADSSGDTFLFTSYVYMSFKAWPYGAPATSTLTSKDSHLTGETGNSGMVQGLSTTQYSIGYVGISYMASAVSDGLQYAAVGDNASLSASGGVVASNYVLPTGGATGTIAQDANLGLQQINFATYGMAVSLILGGSWAGAVNLISGGGGSNPTTASPTPYPIVNLEYLMVKLSPTAGTQVSATNLAATIAFLQWAISTGNWAPGSTPSQWIDQVGFLPLTAEVAGYDTQILASMSTS